MTNDRTIPVEPEQPDATQSEAPKDFREYAAWREAGGKLDPKEAAPAAAGERAPEGAPEPQAKTEPASEPEDTQTPGEDDDGPHGKGGSRARKIEKLQREKAEAERQVAELRHQLEIRNQPPPEPQPKPAAPPDPDEPKFDDFENLEQFQKALTKFYVEKYKREMEAEKAVEKIRSAFEQKIAESRKIHPDYDEVINSIPRPTGPGVEDMANAMWEDPAGTEVLYYLAQHPDELGRISAMQPRSAAREIGRIAAKVSQPPSSPESENGKRTVTSAFPPPPASSRPSRPMTESIFDPAVQKDFRRYEKAREALKRGK